MRIVTGHKGTDHITSNDLQGFNQGIFGSGNYVLPVGNKFAAEMVDSTRLSIMDGEGIMQGVHFRNAPLTVTLLTLDSGVSGKNRIDLICARYTKDTSTGVENVSWQVIKGTEVSGIPDEPAYTTGNILNGDTTVDFPLYKVAFEGLTPTVIKKYTSKIQSNDVNVSVTAVSDDTDYKLSKFTNLSLGKGTYIISGDACASIASGTLKSMRLSISVGGSATPTCASDHQYPTGHGSAKIYGTISRMLTLASDDYITLQCDVWEATQVNGTVVMNLSACRV